MTKEAKEYVDRCLDRANSNAHLDNYGTNYALLAIAQTLIGIEESLEKLTFMLQPSAKSGSRKTASPGA